MSAEAIARGLSEELVEAFREADTSDMHCQYCGPIYSSEYGPQLLDAYPAHDDPDCLPEDDGGTIWTWTPLGLEVRAIIAGETK